MAGPLATWARCPTAGRADPVELSSREIQTHRLIRRRARRFPQLPPLSKQGTALGVALPLTMYLLQEPRRLGSPVRLIPPYSNSRTSYRGPAPLLPRQTCSDDLKSSRRTVGRPRWLAPRYVTRSGLLEPRNDNQSWVPFQSIDPQRPAPF